MRKLSLVILALAVGLTLAGCKKANPADEYDVVALGIKPTGVTLDISDKNGSSVTAAPGDVLYLKLVSPAVATKQWTVVAPTSGQPLMLQERKVADRQNEQATEFVDEWWLKIEQTGNFPLQFDYGQAGKKAENSFAVGIISQ